MRQAAAILLSRREAKVPTFVTLILVVAAVAVAGCQQTPARDPKHDGTDGKMEKKYDLARREMKPDLNHNYIQAAAAGSGGALAKFLNSDNEAEPPLFNGGGALSSTALFAMAGLGGGPGNML